MPPQHGANCLVVACPMCHVNLDMKQADIERHYGVKHGMPVYYLSDLVGWRWVSSLRHLGIDRHFVWRRTLRDWVGSRRMHWAW